MAYPKKKWKEAHKLAIEGVKFSAIESITGIKESAIKQRSVNDRWLTPKKLDNIAKAKAREEQAATIQMVEDEVAKRYALERNHHRDKITEIAKQVIKQLDPTKLQIKTVKDLKYIDDIARRNLGMDLEDASNAKRINPALYPTQT